MDYTVIAPIFSSIYTLSYVEEDQGNTYEIVFSDESLTIFIPKFKLPYYKEYLLAYRVQKKLIDLHEYTLKTKSLILLKNFYKLEDLVEFDLDNKTYHYTSLRDHNIIDDKTEDLIRDWFIDLNISLNKLGYTKN
jgi:hypothetical protein